MKKYIVILVLVLASLVLFAACGDKHTHSYGEWEMVVKADCQTKGVMIRTCSSCGNSETSIIANGDHKLEKIAAVEATCTITGLTEGEKCSLCGFESKAQQIVTGQHKLEKVAAVEATCATEGLTEGEKCSLCGYESKPQQKIDKLAHNYTSVVTTEATCVKKGIKTYTCTKCNNSYTAEFEKEKYTGTQIHQMTQNSVGQIKTYTKGGEAYASGTGFVWTSDGKIITNYHVIEHAFSAEITLAGKTYPITKVLGFDSYIDIAILQISATGLTPIKVCEETVPTGSIAFAFGNPKGYTDTFSQGVVTNNNRVIDGITFIQHDAALSSGNSGGPLINEYCEVIGINTWVRLDGQNLNFAVESAEIKNIDTSKSYTLEEVYYIDHSEAYFDIIEWVKQNGEFDGSFYDIYEDFEEGWYNLYYDVEEESLCISRVHIFEDGTKFAIYLALDKENENYYEWFYYTFPDGEKIGGDATVVAYSANSIKIDNISDSYYQEPISQMNSISVQLTIKWFGDMLYEYTYYTLSDFGFVWYE